ncbi:hypothetical protein [Allokutzneria oryzae]|uniref:DUF4232 domain-containing protein n=1 Tax=Allokutzneria oryzae TaxID=1378989 RepID=A0ABV6A0V3_9PSEU
MSGISKRTFGIALTAAAVAVGAFAAGVANAGTNPPPELGSCAAGDLTAVVSEGVSPTRTDKLFRITFSASRPGVSCGLRGANGALLGVEVNPLTTGGTPPPVLIDADHQADAHVVTPQPHEQGAPANSVSFTLPGGGPAGIPFDVAWPSDINGPVGITAVVVPVS